MKTIEEHALDITSRNKINVMCSCGELLAIDQLGNFAARRVDQCKCHDCILRQIEFDTGWLQRIRIRESRRKFRLDGSFLLEHGVS